jgi:peptide chain release factor 2
MPKIENSKEIAISPGDLKIDTYRASGHGGQSVNTTDSAVRITHLPTGIVATCQNERSQLQNKENAMNVLSARLAKMLEDQHKEKIDELRGESMEPERGSQIRSYVLHPYKLVKDHRTLYESKNPDAVLDGDINDFIESELKYFNKKS